MSEYTQFIEDLAEDEVFVFGSNLGGFHGAGSAGFAMRGVTANTWRNDQAFLDILRGRNPDKRGRWAVFGVGRGFQRGRDGRSYAIATVERAGEQGCVTIDHFRRQAQQFIAFAQDHPELRFLVVKLGATRSEGGYSWLGLHNVARVWSEIHDSVGLPDNVVLPHSQDPRGTISQQTTI